MVLRYNRKGMSLSFNQLITMIIMIVVVLFVSFYSAGVGAKTSDGVKDASNIQCQFNSELCDDSDIDSNRISCELDRESLESLQFDISNYDLELKGDYKTKFNSKLSFQEIETIEQTAKNLNMEPIHLFAVINFETAGTFSTDIKNGKGSGATGLIQFMPKTAVSLGTTTDELAKMNIFEQLVYVEKYFNQFNNRNYDSLEDVYMDVLYPVAHGKGLDYVLFTKDCGKTYDQNPLDTDKDGYVIVAEAVEKVVQNYNS